MTDERSALPGAAAVASQAGTSSMNEPRPAPPVDVEEQRRLNEAREAGSPWKKWGPYLSERQWGTVREDYSEDGDAWNYFTHDQARSRAYRWGEDGLAGISDDQQRLCFALALWNGRDPILKERLFGLTNSEGNHGEDVKEYYFYLDSTPTHSYMKYLYKYPQAAFPYDDLVATNRRRSRDELEYELLDTGVFDGDRYFDVFVEYAKAAPEDVLIRITVDNRGRRRRRCTCCRRSGSATPGRGAACSRKPGAAQRSTGAIHGLAPRAGRATSSVPTGAELLFTENETNPQRLVGHAQRPPYVKDAFHESRGGQGGRGQPGAGRARRRRPTTASRCPPGLDARPPAPVGCRGGRAPRRHAPSETTSTRSLAHGSPRPTSSTRRITPPR